MIKELKIERYESPHNEPCVSVVAKGFRGGVACFNAFLDFTCGDKELLELVSHHYDIMSKGVEDNEKWEAQNDR